MDYGFEESLTTVSAMLRKQKWMLCKNHPAARVAHQHVETQEQINCQRAEQR